MIKRTYLSFLGILLIVVSLAGMAISVYGIVSLWRVTPGIKVSLDSSLATLEATLQTTSDGLSVASSSLEQANDSLGLLVTTIKTTGKSVEDTVPLIDTLSSVTTKDLPETISSTQEAIKSAQASARIIESTLSAISSIPFLGLDDYNTSVPLSAALEELSESLDPISNSLSSMDNALSASKENMSAIGVSSAEIATSVTAIKTGLGEAEEVSVQYLQIIDDVSQQAASARENMPVMLDRILWIFTIALIWLGLAQIGLLLQGLELLGARYPKEPQGSKEKNNSAETTTTGSESIPSVDQ